MEAVAHAGSFHGVQAATERQVEIPNPWPAGYGYQWWCMELPLENKSFSCYFATGNGGNKIYVLPSLDMVIGMASSAYNQPYSHARSHEILQRVIRATT